MQSVLDSGCATIELLDVAIMFLKIVLGTIAKELLCLNCLQSQRMNTNDLGNHAFVFVLRFALDAELTAATCVTQSSMQQEGL